jgi:iron complex transport system substrate-binding protein
MKGLRIVSFLPSATEMVCALGLEDQLVGISHECDYPESVRKKPVVVRSAIPVKTMGLQKIDQAVSERLEAGGSLYRVDEKLLQELEPDLILTQDLCQVCAPSGNEVTQLLKSLRKKPEILWLTPKSLDQIHDNLLEIGKTTGRAAEAEKLIKAGRARLEKVAAAAKKPASVPRVFSMEWIDPVYCSGHWVPEMIELAGGVDRLSKKGTDSVRIPWDNVLKWDPEVLVINPCGFKLKDVMNQVPQILKYPHWDQISAVKNGRVYAVDANSYFARPGPRVIDGTELLAHLIHPELFDWRGPRDAFRRV